MRRHPSFCLAAAQDRGLTYPTDCTAYALATSDTPRVAELNLAAEGIFGYCRSEVIGLPLAEVIHQEQEVARMLFDFTEAERNTARHALELYVSELKDEIGRTERHEWRESLRLEREILERVIEQLSV